MLHKYELISRAEWIFYSDLVQSTKMRSILIRKVIHCIKTGSVKSLDGIWEFYSSLNRPSSIPVCLNVGLPILRDNFGCQKNLRILM